MTGIVLAQGKTKTIIDARNGEVLVTSRDDITAGDGAKHDVLEGKALASTTTTCNVFLLLEAMGIRTHFLRREDWRTFRARHVRMIPLELVVRRVAAGSYLKRNPEVVEGTIFGELVMEFFEKDDANHDPLVQFDFKKGLLYRYAAKQLLSEGLIGSEPLEGSRFSELDAETIAALTLISKRVFEILEEAWAELDVTLVDLKIECGWDVETGELLVADVIDNDSWRIWPGGDKTRMKDKQSYRDLDTSDPGAKAEKLGKITDDYKWVAAATASTAAFQRAR